MIRFVVPAFNEEANIENLFADLKPRVAALGARVILVEDGSSDNTIAEIEKHRGDMNLRVVRHPRNLGLGTAINSGLRAALEESEDDDAIVTLEADCTSDLDDLPRMLELFDQGFDIVLASVYAPGGKIIGVDGWRLWASKGVSGAFRVAGGLREIHTLSSLYRVYRAGTLRRAVATYGFLLVREPGFAANVELLLKLHNAGASIAEVPTINDWTKRGGVSKMQLGPTVRAYGRLMAAHLVGRIQPPPISPLTFDGGFHSPDAAAPVDSTTPSPQHAAETTAAPSSNGNAPSPTEASGDAKVA